jgi:hypothetical protein
MIEEIDAHVLNDFLVYTDGNAIYTLKVFVKPSHL